jgi:phospholipase/carboxylesterase
MKHIYQKGTKEVTFLMLHGTGGNEYDLLPIAKHIDSEANVLSVRGNVMEYGMPRFFKRLAMGVFDVESLIEETHNLYEFIQDSAKQYGFDPKKVIAIGYSNGANIASSILMHYKKAFSKAILFHPMVPLRNIELPDMSEVEIFVGAGKNDHMMPEHEVHELIKIFESRNAHVDLFWSDNGHQLTKEEIEAAKQWYSKSE